MIFHRVSTIAMDIFSGENLEQRKTNWTKLLADVISISAKLNPYNSFLVKFAKQLVPCSDFITGI